MRTDKDRPDAKNKKVRCAIYTRKSHEEGLEQEFNSLDAQREAGMSYIASQKHEGWELINTHYDDGGHSGGTIERPALKQLLTEIEYGGIDLIVVCKVDRLSRSLSDFARLVELFDKHNVSFVSVTQQFNTASSMGRLTLNVLLSFAQYEREITGERIRDKIAASKKKGLWMGGMPPLGYCVKARRLVPIPEEAQLIEAIFNTYLNAPSLVTLAQSLNKDGFTTKQWKSQANNDLGGKPLTPKYLYRILINPVYIGKIKHKGKTYAGQHDAIVSDTLFFNVNQTIETQSLRSQSKWTSPFLLKGKIRHYQGYAMSPSSVKPKNSPSNSNKPKQPIRYYVSQKAIQQGYRHCSLKCINAQHVESIVIAAIFKQLGNESSATFLSIMDEDEQTHELRGVIRKVTLSPERLTLELDRSQLDNLKVLLSRQEKPKELINLPDLIYKPQITKNRSVIILKFNIQIKKLDGRRYILDSQGKDIIVNNALPNPSIVEAMGRAYVWRKLLNSGEFNTIKQMTQHLGFEKEFVRKHLTLTTLSPDIQNKALTGLLPQSVGVKQLIQASKLLNWKQQRQFLRI